MPVTKYFLFVGGVLLALLLIADLCLPKLPVAASADADLPVIKIQSERKWPERVVYDAGVPTIIPERAANMEAQAVASITNHLTEVREREAFAQLQPSDVNQIKPPDPKKPAPKMQRQHKNARRHAVQPLPAARPPRFGWFGNGIW